MIFKVGDKVLVFVGGEYLDGEVVLVMEGWMDVEYWVLEGCGYSLRGNRFYVNELLGGYREMVVRSSRNELDRIVDVGGFVID